MPREGTSSEAQWLAGLINPLVPGASEALNRALYRRLRALMTEGTLTATQAMPASRTLARALRLSRNTVLAAYDQLISEGFLETRAGAGTYVAAVAANQQKHAAQTNHPGLSERGGQFFANCNQISPPRGAFVPGIPALDVFPVTLWQRYLARHVAHPQREWLGYTQEGGLPELRIALSDYLIQARGVRAAADSILITNSAQQALELAARLLADPGEVAWMEEPGYTGARLAFAAAELHLTPVPVDEQGLNPALAPPGSAPRLIYVTPSHQYPTGVVMTLARRRELLAAADKHNAWIVEDDYDSEFRYSSAPIAALQGLSDNARVIYIGTFSKVLYPGLRLAYMVLPDALIETFRTTHARLYREGNYAIQAALADFITDGQFGRHIRRMRSLYQRRQELLRATLNRELEGGLPLSPGEAGLHLLAELPMAFPAARLIEQARSEDVYLRPIASYYQGTPERNGLVLGYAGVPEKEIERAGRRLGQWLSEQLS